MQDEESDELIMYHASCSPMFLSIPERDAFVSTVNSVFLFFVTVQWLAASENAGTLLSEMAVSVIPADLAGSAGRPRAFEDC